MKILVYGAGVIGSYLIHVLCTANNDVTVLARGKHKEILESHGLEIYNHLQHKTTNDKVRVIDRIKDSIVPKAALESQEEKND